MRLVASIGLFIAMLLSVAQALEFFKIEERFRQSQSSRNQFTLPAIAHELSLEEELTEYTQMHGTAEFKQFKADPQLSAKLLLTREGSRSRSLFFVGKELNIVMLEVTVTHRGDHYNHEKDAVDVYLINYETNEVLIAERVRHVRLFRVEVVSELYEISVVYDWPAKPEGMGNDTDEESKHVAIDMDLVPISAGKQAQVVDDGATTVSKLSVIKSETDRVFINSLQIWQQIGRHHEQHFTNQQQVYLRAYFQLLIVFAINFIELMLIRRTLKLPSVI